MSLKRKDAPGDARERLLAAAKSLLWERGFESMSPRAVLDRSGVGQGSLYHHFRSKADLAGTALEAIGREFATSARRELGSERGTPLGRIRRYLAVERDGLAGCRFGRLTPETSIADPRLRDPIAAYFIELESLLAHNIVAAQQAGELPPLDADALARTIAATVQGGYVLARALQDGAEMRRATAGLAALLDLLAAR